MLTLAMLETGVDKGQGSHWPAGAAAGPAAQSGAGRVWLGCVGGLLPGGRYDTSPCTLSVLYVFAGICAVWMSYASDAELSVVSVAH